MKVVDLFCGVGGMTSGFIQANYEVVGAFDNWAKALDVHKINHPNVQTTLQDLSKIDESCKLINKVEPQVIVGGPPCQDFSSAGNRSEGQRADLTSAFAKIVARVEPKWFVMENVGRTQSSKTFEKAREIFSKKYGFLEVLLTSSRYGVPQLRKRFFCIGRRLSSWKDKESAVLELKHWKSHILNSGSDKHLTIRDYVGNEFGLEYYYRHPRNYSRRAIYSIDEPSPTVRGVNRPVAPGYPGHRADAADFKKIPNLRPLTTMERARIQTFPKTFKLEGGKTDQEQMIGNAVPVELARRLAEFISNFDKGLAVDSYKESQAEFLFEQKLIAV